MKQRIVTYLQATKSWDRKRAIQYCEACNAVQMFFKLSCHPSRCGYMIVKIASKSPWVCMCLSTENWWSAYGKTDKLRCIWYGTDSTVTSEGIIGLDFLKRGFFGGQKQNKTKPTKQQQASLQWRNQAPFFFSTYRTSLMGWVVGCLMCSHSV